MRLAQGRYSSGVGVFLDVLDSQAALLVANTNAVNAQSAVNIATVALSHSLGQLPAKAVQDGAGQASNTRDGSASQ